MPENKNESFSYKVNVGHLSVNPVYVTMEADERERAELADRWGVNKVNALKAELELLRWKRDGVRIKGRVRAELEQECVVTLEPVQSHIDEVIDALFVPDGSKLARIPVDETGEMVFDADGPDLPETFTGDSIDVGSVCEEFIVLAIDPYPRKEGAVLEATDEMPPDEDRPPSPFAGLKHWSKD